MRKNKSLPIQAVIIDDSPAVKELLISILHSSGDINVVGTGNTGEDALRLVQRLHPDVLTMDVRIPKIDGLEATRQIMRESPTPIVIITGTLKQPDMDLTYQALDSGALAVIPKPGLNDPETCQKVIDTVRLMADVPVIHHWGRKKPPHNSTDENNHLIPVSMPLVKINRLDFDVLGIAASTGGPSALASILRDLPVDFPLPILVIQHVSQGFAGGLAQWLGTQIRMPAEIAHHGDPLLPGVVLIAPDDYHLQVSERGTVELSKAPPYKGLRPSANQLFTSLARVFGSRAVGVILTGMGDDGAEGISALHQAGGLTIAQDADSCVVYGMPREAIGRKAVDYILTLEHLALLFKQLAGISSPSLVHDMVG